MRDITLGDTFYHKFTTRDVDTMIPQTLAGTPVISAYEDGSVTQITAGITLTVDFDSVTGLNSVAVVATGGNGFENGKSYSLVITTGTVDTVSVVGEVVHEFTIGLSAAAVDLANGTDGLSALKTLIDTADSAIDVAVADLANGTDGLGALKALIDTLTSNLATVDTEVGGIQTDLSNATDGLGALKTLIDNVNTDLSNGTDGLGALKALIDTANTAIVAIKAVTDVMPNAGALSDLATIEARLVGITLLAQWLGALGGKQVADATAQAEIRATGGGSGTYDPTADSQEAIGDKTALASVASEARLAELDAGNLPSDIDGIQTDLSNATDGLGALKTLIDAVQTDLDNGTDGLGAIKALIDGLNDPTAAAIADAVWDELQSAHVIAGSFGVMATELAALQTDLDNGTDGLGAIKALIDTLTTNVGTVDTAVTAVQADLDNGTDGLGALKALIDALNDISVSDILTTAITESYAADGSAPTLAQFMSMGMARQGFGKSSISGTTWTFYKLDGTTTAFTFTLNDGTSPTAFERTG